MLVAQGDFEQTIFGAANYGRDNHSIAGMAGAIAGALHGEAVIRADWIARINEANRVDLDPLAHGLAELTMTLQREQFAAAVARRAAFEALA